MSSPGMAPLGNVICIRACQIAYHRDSGLTVEGKSVSVPVQSGAIPTARAVVRVTVNMFRMMVRFITVSFDCFVLLSGKIGLVLRQIFWGQTAIASSALTSPVRALVTVKGGYR